MQLINIKLFSEHGKLPNWSRISYLKRELESEGMNYSFIDHL